MKTIGELLTERSREINNPFYRMRLALRDEPDYYNDDESQPEPQIEKVTRVIYEHIPLTPSTPIETIEKPAVNVPDGEVEKISSPERIDITERFFGR